MLIKKIQKSTDENNELERKRKKFIEAGGSSSIKDSTWININLRITKDMVSKIDEIIKTKRIGMNRTSWILESIQNHLES